MIFTFKNLCKIFLSLKVQLQLPKINTFYLVPCLSFLPPAQKYEFKSWANKI